MVVKPMFILYHKLVNIFYFFPKTWFLSKGNIDEAGLEPGGATKYLKFITFQYLKLFEKKYSKTYLDTLLVILGSAVSKLQVSSQYPQA